MPKESGHHIESHFPFIADEGRVTPLEVSDTFWADIGSGAFGELGTGVLVSTFAFERDWDSWEVHPAGDEVVCLLEGDVELVLDLPDGEKVVALREPGAFVIVPRGTWHTARTRTPSRALFLTRGDDTDHRPA